ncbi:HNH endonuclease [Salinirubellus salinus]|uniref:HNH endonuclease n=1 Tax=Salinirubellus salinus TaxID=1364945 RepID=A0A9E7R7Y8_9EURY|nr:HNH endonuclease signature motif containing protein [Salinirubellus salinus]UWM56273.1 HNH endonuclease [Salinirubellus salinus]
MLRCLAAGDPEVLGRARHPDARRRVRARDEVCQECGDDGSATYLDVHHTVPVCTFHESDTVNVADAHDEGNLVLLCRSCHARAGLGQLEFESTLEHSF